MVGTIPSLYDTQLNVFRFIHSLNDVNRDIKQVKMDSEALHDRIRKISNHRSAAALGARDDRVQLHRQFCVAALVSLDLRVAVAQWSQRVLDIQDDRGDYGWPGVGELHMHQLKLWADSLGFYTKHQKNFQEIWDPSYWA